jgi:hypothetical protein
MQALEWKQAPEKSMQGVNILSKQDNKTFKTAPI